MSFTLITYEEKWVLQSSDHINTVLGKTKQGKKHIEMTQGWPEHDNNETEFTIYPNTEENKG